MCRPTVIHLFVFIEMPTISHLSKALIYNEGIKVLVLVLVRYWYKVLVLVSSIRYEGIMLMKCLSLLCPLSVKSGEKLFDVCVKTHVCTTLPPEIFLPRVFPPPIIWLTQITWCPQILLLFCWKMERLVLIPVCHGLHVINKWNQDLMERIVLVKFVHIFNSCYFTSHKLKTWFWIFHVLLPDPGKNCLNAFRSHCIFTFI